MGKKGKRVMMGGAPVILFNEPSAHAIEVMRESYPSKPGFGAHQQEKMAKKYAIWLAGKMGYGIEEHAMAFPVWEQVAGEKKPRISAMRFSGLVVKIPNWNWKPEIFEGEEEAAAMPLAA